MRVIVIGAGVAGLSIAWRLAQAGVEVRVLERAMPGRGATYASAGMIAATAEAAGMHPHEAAFARAAQEAWPDFAAEIEAASGLPLSYRRDGVLIAAATPEEEDHLRAAGGAPGCAFLAPEDVYARAPMLRPGLRGALWAEAEAQVDNRMLGRALARAARMAGATISAGETVIRVDRFGGDGLVAVTPFAHYEADIVLLAAGAWCGQILGLDEAGPIPVHPVKGEMIAFEAPPGAAMPAPLLWGHSCYLVPRGGRIFVGATSVEAGFDTALTGGARRDLHARATALMPALSEWTLVEQWAGLRPASADGLPLLGETRMKGVFVAGGQFRNGILLAPAIAHAMGQLILGHAAPQIAAFSPARFADEAALRQDG